MNEFELIDEIIKTLGDVTRGDAVVIGPGDDSAALRVPPGQLLISSIDTLIEGVHFPQGAPGELVGYRCLMVGLSDLAAMGAQPAMVLVALTLASADVEWVTSLARGLRDAAQTTGVRIVGGNITKGATAINVSVHGFAPEDSLLRRSGASPGDGIYVTGELGGAAAALARGDLLELADDLDALASRYYRPQARLETGVELRGIASSAIDVSDGLLQDLHHLAASSAFAMFIESDLLPISPGASLKDALLGGDDYELCFTAAAELPTLSVPVARIGAVERGEGVWLDGERVSPTGYQHF